MEDRTCGRCGREFKKPSGLRHHQKDESACESACARDQLENSPWATGAAPTEDRTCGRCGREFKKPSGLRRHQKGESACAAGARDQLENPPRVTPWPKIRCGSCGLAFAQTVLLKKHQRGACRRAANHRKSRGSTKRRANQEFSSFGLFWLRPSAEAMRKYRAEEWRRYISEFDELHGGWGDDALAQDVPEPDAETPAREAQPGAEGESDATGGD